MTYTIRVEETLSRDVDVEAKTEAEALGIVRGLWKSEELVLDSDDFGGVEFEVVR